MAHIHTWSGLHKSYLKNNKLTFIYGMNSFNGMPAMKIQTL